MISYENYKIIHLTSILILFTGLAISFYGQHDRVIKILTGVGTLLTFVAGMGLMARLEMKHTEPWPTWIKVKMAIWFFVGVGGALIARRYPKYGRPAYFLSLVLFVVAAYMANYKIE
ncbi:MAG TPA: hypothetical protein VNJ01_16960 [Bacteriovoracaceae bacterium]|nr:hypothetical protein [Bacteriovoracaceae bacterium]